MPFIKNPQPVRPTVYNNKDVAIALSGMPNWGAYVSKFRSIDRNKPNQPNKPVRPTLIYRQPGKGNRRIKVPTMLTNAMAQGAERERQGAGNPWMLGRDNQRVVQTWADQGKAANYWPGQTSSQEGGKPVRPQYAGDYWPYQYQLGGKGPGYQPVKGVAKGAAGAIGQGKYKGIGLQGVSDMIENIRARNEELELQFDMLRAEQEQPEEPGYSYGGGGYGGWGGWSGGYGSRGSYYNPYAWYWSLLNWRI